MGSRSQAPQTEADVAELTLPELNQLIAFAEHRATTMRLSASLTKSAMKRLVWLEAAREKIHGVKAPKRGRF